MMKKILTKNSRLTGLRVYLSGPCENLSDSGASWRTEITPKLKNLGLIVFDPVHKNGIQLSFSKTNEEEFGLVKKLRDQGRFEELTKCMKEVVRVDLRLCDCADILIVQLDATTNTAGSIDEIVTASNQKKPIFLCSKQGAKTIPLWLFGRIPSNYIFNSLDDILAKLTEIAYCSDKRLPSLIDKRWMFSNKLGV